MKKHSRSLLFLAAGLVLLLAFAFGWHLLPPSGSKGWQALILPSVALALPVAVVLFYRESYLPRPERVWSQLSKAPPSPSTTKRWAARNTCGSARRKR